MKSIYIPTLTIFFGIIHLYVEIIVDVLGLLFRITECGYFLIVDIIIIFLLILLENLCGWC